MSGIWGKNIKVSIFGESHGKAIGITIDGLPPGIELDTEYINSEMQRRAPGKDSISTPRKEADEFEILSGYFDGKTTGTPLCGVIWNSNQKSKDYDSVRYVMRPSHGDYPGFVKYKGHNDYRGGGHFSGRITAPLVFAGAIAKQILEKKGIVIGSHIKRIENVEDENIDYTNIDESVLKGIRNKPFPVIDDESGKQMKEAILKAREDLDSVGGVIEGIVLNLEAGLGSPFFESVESKLSQTMFSIPGVKGIEFGVGFDISKMRGSKANDEYFIENDEIKTYTNNNGGITGGITNGMPVIFRVAMKPTPSISKKQRTIDINKMENTEVEVHGRHDPCIVQRAVPVVESACALTILDFVLGKGEL
ncbi:chorismate synthase AroC [Gottschalkia acidurici 9a]|uniref:Chorismate synthase n=1 Tax=Gottschalkia acidurici (strain ATCC 7906 / DSM 604 / BCRC 14475 / CIP 104303 / KCTC 5404 / NCIMB 10678 / 9a) TaxID=1128398 RepID=K0AWM7_GOTA9|nr:chorismate synthase [Gottschalkia acidurici]AFS78233.1 chorismate synthase AroC [Gottschalkia acidurici 9a]